MGRIIDRVKEGKSVVCGSKVIGKVSRIVKDPDWNKTTLFTVKTESKEIPLPIESIHQASDEEIALGCTLDSIEALPDVSGSDLLNEAGYINYGLKLKVNEALNLARPFIDYH